MFGCRPSRDRAPPAGPDRRARLPWPPATVPLPGRRSRPAAGGSGEPRSCRCRAAPSRPAAGFAPLSPAPVPLPPRPADPAASRSGGTSASNRARATGSRRRRAARVRSACMRARWVFSTCADAVEQQLIALHGRPRSCSGSGDQAAKAVGLLPAEPVRQQWHRVGRRIDGEPHLDRRQPRELLPGPCALRTVR